MRRLLMMLGIVCSLSIVLGGCSGAESPERVISVPQMSAKQKDIQIAVQANKPKNATLVRSEGSGSEAQIVPIDLDKDGKEEIVFCYKRRFDPVHLAVLKKNKGKWIKVVDQILNGDHLDLLSFKDLTGGGRPNILVGSGGFDQNRLAVYTFDKNHLDEVFGRYYTKAVVYDYTNDGYPDITLIQLKRGKSFTVNTYDLAHSDRKKEDHATSLDDVEVDFGGKLVSKASLDPFINGITKISSGHLTKTINGLLIDVGVGAHSGETLVLSFQNGKWQKYENDKLFQAQTVESGDIDGDGRLEITGLEWPKGWDDVPYSDMLWLTNYYEWSPAGLKLDHQAYNDYTHGFSIDFPHDWINQITIQRGGSKQEVTLIDKKSGAKRLTVRWMKKTAVIDRKQWEVVGHSTSYTFVVPREQASLKKWVNVIR